MVEHLYIHIPFCHRICPYCAFYKHKPGATNYGDFVNALTRELEIHARELEIRPRTIYCGGGTPSLLPSAQIQQLTDGIASQVNLDALEEFTFEANPKTFGADKAAAMRRAGITRISLGVQSWDPQTLHTLGRDHSPDEASEAYHLLRDAELPSINIDLMFSIPGQDNATWLAGLEQSIKLQPDHISAYNLTYEEDTEFLTKLRKGTPGFYEDEDTDATQFHTTRTTLAAAGLEPYEISNYATPGHRSKHNAAYWSGNDYLGLGPSAVSTINGTRSQNPSNTEAYTSAPDTLDRTHEHLTPEDFRIERIALGLRLAEGIPLTLLSKLAITRAQTLSTESLLTCSPTHLTLTEKGMPLTDEIAAELIL